MPPPDDAALRALSQPERALLSALAIAPGGLSRSALLKTLLAQSIQLDGKRPDGARLAAMLLPLQRNGWLGSAASGELQPVRLRDDRRNLMLLDLCAREDLDAWMRIMWADLPQRPEWMASDRARAEQVLWLSVLSGDGEAAVRELRQLLRTMPAEALAGIHPLPLLLADEHGRAVFARFAPGLRRLLLADYLQLSSHFLFGSATVAYQAGLALWRGPKAEGERALAQQLLVQAFLRGDTAAMQRLGATPGLDALAAFLQALTSGEPAQALQWLAQWIDSERKRTGKPQIDLPRPIEALRLLALIGTGDSATYPALRQTLQRGMQQSAAGHALLLQLLDRRLGAPAGLDASTMAQVALRESAHGLDCLLVMLSVHWLNVSVPQWAQRQRAWRQRLAAAGYDWLAAEFEAVMAIDAEGDAARKPAEPDGPTATVATPAPTITTAWHTTHARVPLVGLYRRPEAWESALQALTAIRGVAPAAPAPVVERRLAWFITLLHGDASVEPREQKRGAKGHWSRGRAVALRRLRDEITGIDYLIEQDRQAIAAIEVQPASLGGPQYSLPGEQALSRLVGHPALYWADAPDVRVDLQQGEPSLHLREHEGRIELQLEPEGIGGDDDLVLHKETPTRLRLYRSTPELKQIAGIVGAGLRVPAAARAQLVEAISAIAPLLPVHSDIPGLTAHLDTIDGDPMLYAHLLPLSEGLRLQLLVRPQAEGAWCRPGHGAVHLLGERDDKPLQIRRDLEAERASLQYVLEHCPALARADSDGQEWQLEHVQDALQLLSELQALDGQRVQCVWPEGERMRIRSRPGMRQLRLSLRQQGDWFALQGEVALDDGRVMQLRQLLELMRGSPGRFVRLGDGDWLALGDDLRKRLDELLHLAERVNEQGVRLNVLTAPLLATLAEEVADFEADEAWQQQLERLQSLRDFDPPAPRALQAELRDYPREGFSWLARMAQWGVGGCLPDDMGLGKTVQLLALLLHRAELGPQLVVAPTSVVSNWQAEAQRFAPTLRLHDYRSARRLEALGPGDVVLVSYSLLQFDHAAFAAQPWTSVVLDEAQAVKNAQTKRSQAVMALDAGFKVVASGTPLENHLGELWNLFRFINPGLFGRKEQFASRFASPIESGDASARRALKQMIQPFMLRRLKSQVLDELPARTDITHMVRLSDAEMHQYEALRQQAVAELEQTRRESGGRGDDSLKVLAQITRLRRFCCHPSLVLPGSRLESSKLNALAGIVTELIDNGHRALVFSQFVDHLRIVRAWLDEQGIAYQYLDGSTPVRQRKEAVDAFQGGQGEVFLISLKAGGSGLNLTAADYVIHLDPWWNPAVEDQASDRAHRIGQLRPVTVYRLVAEHTIEEQIVALHAHKRDLADSLLEGGEVSARLDAEALLSLIRQD